MGCCGKKTGARTQPAVPLAPRAAAVRPKGSTPPPGSASRDVQKNAVVSGSPGIARLPRDGKACRFCGTLTERQMRFDDKVKRYVVSYSCSTCKKIVP